MNAPRVATIAEHQPDGSGTTTGSPAAPAQRPKLIVDSFVDSFVSVVEHKRHHSLLENGEWLPVSTHLRDHRRDFDYEDVSACGAAPVACECDELSVSADVGSGRVPVVAINRMMM